MKKNYIQPQVEADNVALFSNLMGASTFGFGEEGKDQSTARAPRRGGPIE